MSMTDAPPKLDTLGSSTQFNRGIMRRQRRSRNNGDRPRSAWKPEVIQDRVKRSMDHYKTRREGWETCYDYFRGEFRYPWLDVEALAVFVNIIKPTIETMFSGTTLEKPKLHVHAQVEEIDDETAEVAEEVVNYWWRRYGVQRPFRLACLDALKIGHGWIKTTWTRNESKVPRSQQERDALVAELIGQRDQAVSIDPELAADLPSDEDVIRSVDDEMKNNPETVVTEHPTVTRISPFHMHVNPDATSMDDVTWIAQEMWVPIKELKANGMYSRSARSKAMPHRTGAGEADDYQTERSRMDDWSKSSRTDDDEFGLVRVIEYHDLIEGRYAVFAWDAGSFLLEPTVSPWSDTISKSPFEMIRNSETGDFHPMGEIESLIGLQDELNATRTDIQAIQGAMIPKTATTQALSQETKDQITDRRPGTMVELDDPYMPIERQIGPIRTPDVPYDFYNNNDLIMSNLEQVSALSGWQRGETDSGRRSATEAAGLIDAVQRRQSEKIYVFQDAAAAMGQRLIVMAQIFVSQRTAFRLAGSKAQAWRSFEPGEIRGQFVFEVEYASMMPRDDITLRQEAIQEFPLIMQMIVELGTVDPILATEYFLRKFGVTNPHELMVQGGTQEFSPANANFLLQQQGPGPGAGGAAPPQGAMP